MDKLDLWSLNYNELAELLCSWGEPAYRADQVYDWLYRSLILSVDDMTNLPIRLRQRLMGMATLPSLDVGQKHYSSDANAVKFLFLAADGQAIEGVLLKYRRWFSACLSSQAGCRMGCAFCASTLGGLVRNLSVGEMVGQLIYLTREAKRLGADLRSLVLMGSGEPLDNYENVLRFLTQVTEPNGFDLSYRRLTLSTCGLVPEIRRLARERLPLTLAVSLHAPTDDLRTELMPVNRIYPLAELMIACCQYVELTGRRLTFEYVLLARVNDSPYQAHQLAELIGTLPCHVNIIPFNPVPGSSFKAPTPDRVRLFYQVLQTRGIPVTVRRELGQDIEAACGQLRHRALKKRT
ncbi:MAG TPA: 23S rRNA (adenine(2503)-C(2))-methyltransferase RlmN [bacterium]|jgi:23S rRNA (adenine2503-C2)-methyltransferase|nr:23S rRNA (adenine(2503)-C(2))-methyltransferase RlmN [bacterium]